MVVAAELLMKRFALTKGEAIGYYSFFTGISESYKIKSIDFSKLLIIKRENFLELLKEFPDDYE